MAKLIGIVAGNWEYNTKEDVNSYLERTQNLYKQLQEAVPEEGVVGALISFPIADGSALYRVAKEKPLQLELVPYMDAYQIPDAHMRGINLADVKQMVERAKNIASMFKK